MNYNILAPPLIALLAWTFILIWFSKKKKQEKMKRQQLLTQIKEQLPISSFKELLQTLENLNYNPSWCYFKTDTFESGSLAVDNTCFLQRENQWVVCLADWHSFSDELSFDSEQEACEYFVYKYFLLSKEEINWLKQ
ncbi:hypothetical protein [Capnocytophaga granulosa]|uniref:hypothetical protein n=1 Tax=Capnocytophaga granulosa TaxID=45242 RepID=UPI0030B885C1